MSDLPVSQKEFQTKLNGKKTDLFILANSSGMQVGITNYGARVVSWLAPDKQGDYEDIVLGFDSIKGYLEANQIYFGAIIGRYCNRIAEGTFSLDGIKYTLNTNDGSNHLHGGPGGFHNVVWKARQLDEKHLVLQYLSADGEEGYPGFLRVQVVYMLTENNELKIDCTAVTDKKTIVNLTSHSFFNLKGAGSGVINNHELMINATKYTPIDSNLIPTGNITSVERTPFDFQTPKAIGKDLSLENTQLNYAEGYDHNFVLNKEDKGLLTKAAKVYESTSGRVLEVHTTEPGLQFYGGNFLAGSDIGKRGKIYNKRSAFCLEPQHFPNSPNEQSFPSTTLEPDNLYHSHSVYRLSVR